MLGFTSRVLSTEDPGQVDGLETAADEEWAADLEGLETVLASHGDSLGPAFTTAVMGHSISACQILLKSPLVLKFCSLNHAFRYLLDTSCLRFHEVGRTFNGEVCRFVSFFFPVPSLALVNFC